MQLRNKLDLIREAKAKNNGEIYDDLIKRRPNGHLVMQSANFDFILKPDSTAEPRRGQDKSNSAKALIRRAFALMKKKKEMIYQ